MKFKLEFIEFKLKSSTFSSSLCSLYVLFVSQKHTISLAIFCHLKKKIVYLQIDTAI